ncbi:MAG: hypothetical protein JST54_05730 [Deltaproteobacteria bacterium]|nr:hypothetical protein [Deltaproteobacteria bacterium]
MLPPEPELAVLAAFVTPVVPVVPLLEPVLPELPPLDEPLADPLEDPLDELVVQAPRAQCWPAAHAKHDTPLAPHCESDEGTHAPVASQHPAQLSGLQVALLPQPIKTAPRMIKTRVAERITRCPSRGCSHSSPFEAARAGHVMGG